MNNTQLDPILQTYTIQRYLKASAHKGNLELVFKNGLQQPYTSQGTVYIPQLNDKTSTKDLVKLFRYVNHEAAHHAYDTDFKMVTDEAIRPDKSLLGYTFGIVEDLRVDHQDILEWMGDSSMMSTFYEQEHPAMLKAMKEITHDKEMPEKQKAAIQSLVGLDYLTREWCPGASLNLEELVSEMTPEGKQFLNRMAELGIHEKINQLGYTKKDSNKAWEMAQYIYEHVFDEDPEQEKERMKEQQKQEGQGSGEGEEEGNAAGGSNGNEMGTDGKETWDITNATVKWKQLKADNPEDETYGATGIHIDYSNYSRYDAFTPAAPDQIKIVDYEKNIGTNISLKGDDYRHNDDVIKAVHRMNSGNTLANKVRRLLQIRSNSQRIYGQKKGKIDARNLHRVTMKNAPGYNERVFRRTIESDTLNTAVSLVVDFSGSMGGHKSHNAIKSSMLLYDAISRALNVPLEIIGFSDSGKSSIMLLFKSFNGKVSDEILLQRMANGVNYMSGNSDGEAIAWCYDRLERRREKKKLMIVLSDGSPASSRSGDIYAYTKEVIKKIEGAHEADIIGIGIEDRNVKSLYTNHQVLGDSSELEETILKIIESKML